MIKYKSPTVSDLSDNFEVDNFIVQDFVDKLASEIPLHPYPKVELSLMTGVVNWVRPSHILEWGTHFGVSAFIFHKIIHSFNLKTKLITIDIPPSVKHEEQPGNNRGKYIKGINGIEQLLGDGVTTALEFLKNKRNVNNPLFFLDGDHQYKSVRRELMLINKRYPQAYILLHDTFSQLDSSGYNSGPFRAISEFLEQHNEYKHVSTAYGLPGMSFLYPSINTLPLVSVVMPVFNSAKYLGKSLDSVVKQTYSNIEIIVINDGSKDRSSEIIGKFKDSRIKLINFKRNKGIVSALNKGLDLAKGKYIIRMDSDDIAHKDRVKKQVEFMEAHPKIGVCGSAIKVIGRKNYTWFPPTNSEDIKLKMFLESPIAHPSVCIRKKILEVNNLRYDVNYEFAEDYKLWVDMSRYCEMANLDDVLLRYRVHSTQIGATKTKMQQKSVMKVKNELLTLLTGTPTKDELKLHIKAMSWPRNQSNKELEELRSWYEKLVSANYKKQIYNTRKFKAMMGERWVGACYLAKSIGIKRYFIMFNSKAMRLSSLSYIVETKLSSLKQYLLATIKRYV